MTREPNADDVITNEAPGGRSLWRRSRSPHPPPRTGLGDLASSGHHPTWSSQERSRARTAGPERRALWVFASNARFGACGTYAGVRYGRVALLGSALTVTATAESSPSWCGRSNTRARASQCRGARALTEQTKRLRLCSQGGRCADRQGQGNVSSSGGEKRVGVEESRGALGGLAVGLALRWGLKG